MMPKTISLSQTLMNAAKKLNVGSIPNFNFEKNINKFVSGLPRKLNDMKLCLIIISLIISLRGQ